MHARFARHCRGTRIHRFLLPPPLASALSSRDIESLALRQLQDFLNQEIALQSSLSAAAPEAASSVREEEEEEEAAALLAHRRQQVETAMTAQQQSVTGGATAQAAAAAVTAQLNEENVPLPWTGKQKRALAALDFDALAVRIL